MSYTTFEYISLKIDPNDFQVYLNRGEVYYKTGKIDKATMDFKKVLEIDPNNDEAEEWLQKLSENDH